MTDPVSNALRFVGWSRVWSPLVPDAWRAAAWRELALPGRWADAEATFWSTFHVGLPAPRVPLLLHAALARDGAAAREDWLRAASHLGLAAGGPTLPPDHLGVACEVLASALHAHDDVLVRELRARYLEPWCRVARQRLTDDESPFAPLATRFEADLRGLAPGA